MDEPAKPKFDLKVDLDYLKSEAMKYYYNTKNPRLAYLIEG